MKNKKSSKFLFICLVAAVCLLLITPAFVFAGGQQEAGAGSSSDQSKKIFFMVKNLVNPYWIEMTKYAEAKCKEYGYEMEVLSPVKNDNNEEQIQLIEQALLQDPDLFVLVPADTKGIAPAIEDINKENIPIVVCNTKIEGEGLEWLTFVGVQNVEVAYDSATAGAELIGGKGNVIILEGITGAQSSIDRVEGSKKAFAEYPDITLLDIQTGMYQRIKAMEVTQNLLQKYDDIDLIWSASAEMSMGAYEALKQANRQDEIKIVTINAYKEAVEAIADGRIAISYDDSAALQGIKSIEAAHDYFSGKTLPKMVKVEAPKVTKDNIQEYLDKYDIKM